ncbi:MAG: hypothetical protein J5365_06610, partial [Erysipelotrichaceae bacterium]|nr:hypothetical protein [Erysipelotrichaceae bacterium]
GGDMLLYYDRNDFEQTGTLEPVIEIMKKLPKKRLMLGGLIGPLAAFLYCIGFYHIVLITEEQYRILSYAAFLLCCMGIIAGGAYHSHWPYLGMFGHEEQKEELKEIMDYFQKLSVILYLGEGTGLLILLFLIVSGKTVLPVLMALLTPGALFLLRPVVRKLPKGLHMVLYGGFTNIIFILYYLVMLIYACYC